LSGSTHLDHGSDRLHLVLKLRLSTDSNDARIVDGTGDHSVERVGIDGLEKKERTQVSFTFPSFFLLPLKRRKKEPDSRYQRLLGRGTRRKQGRFR